MVDAIVSTFSTRDGAGYDMRLSGPAVGDFERKLTLPYDEEARALVHLV